MPEIEIKVKGHKCNNCSCKWLPCSSKEKPLICPKCKSARWDKEPRKKDVNFLSFSTSFKITMQFYHNTFKYNYFHQLIFIYIKLVS